MGALEEMIRVARSQVGFIEKGNNITPYGQWYGLQGQPYCAMGLCWCHAQVGQSRLVNFSTSKGYAYTPSGAEGFRKRGQSGGNPRVGAHAFMRFPGGPARIHHVGLVIGTSSSYIETIEFNTSRGSGGSQRDGGGCWIRRRGSGIVVYGYPDYASIDGTAPKPAPPANDDRYRAWPGNPSGKYGGYNEAEFKDKIDGNVAWIQWKLNDFTNLMPKLVRDSKYGPKTAAAVRGFQGAMGFKPEHRDGITGPMTWERLRQM